MRRSVPRRGWAGAGDVLLVVLVTALQVTGPRSGSPGHVPDLLAGVAGTSTGVTAFVTAFTPVGALDPTFGSGGSFTTDRPRA